MRLNPVQKIRINNLAHGETNHSVKRLGHVPRLQVNHTKAVLEKEWKDWK